MGLFMGADVPYGFTKVETRDDLEKITNSPILGTVLHSRKKDPNVFQDRLQSNIAEFYRSLSTNLNFYLKNKEQMCILISSSISGEGKSLMPSILRPPMPHWGTKQCR